jgi:hypothetical protein
MPDTFEAVTIEALNAQEADFKRQRIEWRYRVRQYFSRMTGSTHGVFCGGVEHQVQRRWRLPPVMLREDIEMLEQLANSMIEEGNHLLRLANERRRASGLLDPEE